MPSSLMQLAKEGTDAARRALFVQLSDLISGEIHKRTDQELALFSEVALQLYSTATSSDRARLAKNLADCANLPVKLAIKIAEDEVSVAVPILASSTVFTQAELLDLVERLSNQHRQVIARRQDLSTDVSDALMRLGDTPVHRLLAGNREIKLSRQAMTVLVQKAVEDYVLRDDLALRSDLTPAAAQKLIPIVNEETQVRLREIIQGALSQEQLDQIARLKVLRREFGQALENPDMSLLWADAERAHISIDELVILLIQDGRFNHVIELLSHRGRIAQKALKDAVFNGKIEPVVKAAAKARLETATFALFAKARCTHMKIPSRQASDWVKAYSDYLQGTQAAANARCTDFQARRGTRKERANLAKLSLA
ncbi:DUF2336 domain-containing protein [Roseibium denhamense]|uniref:DUF2336 domain-containing protein n=1 Tax=Roseibium denhamense TaxID=76305 RepID=A0ABY1NIS6_9HYPH|nr:DUF2336 domain-containing protein [Roseibium denhamense]MTI06736.1 DUF2336 domain-containing protein [Roseibium denhamense]SMP10752.1 hypothetical protein SAMN06265374_1260 [Roseibium denhamense]